MFQGNHEVLAGGMHYPESFEVSSAGMEELHRPASYMVQSWSFPIDST